MIALLLNLPFFLASAQKLPPILATTRYEKGVYKDFSEFLYNRPSITTDFQILSPSSEQRLENGTADFKLIMLDSAVRRRDVRKFWGACDGESIYVNELLIGGYFKLKKIMGLGRYCYFYGWDPSSYVAAGAMGGLVGGAVMTAANPQTPYILNINNGKIYMLDKILMRTILKQDNELLSRYEAGEKKNKDEVLIEYIKEYNSRHEREAYIEVLDPIEVVLYRRDKKGPSNTVTINLGDTTTLEINSYDLRKYLSTKARLSFCINDECGEIPLVKKRVNYIECVVNKKSDRFELVAVDLKIGEFESKKIEAGMLKNKE